jgi:hypothetical protein
MFFQKQSGRPIVFSFLQNSKLFYYKGLSPPLPAKSFIKFNPQFRIAIQTKPALLWTDTTVGENIWENRFPLSRG